MELLAESEFGTFVSYYVGLLVIDSIFCKVSTSPDFLVHSNLGLYI